MAQIQYVVEGRCALSGSIEPAGNKNAALPIIAASLLTEHRVALENVPRIRDTETLVELVRSVGARAEWIGANTLEIEARSIRASSLDARLCARIRASILLAAPLLARCGEISLPPPGGDVIGRRRVDTHFLALRQLGATVVAKEHFAFRTRGLRGADVFLDEPSVTGTENALMAAVAAEGTTVLRNAASEPHVQDLCALLNAMGARINGIGTNCLVIDGVDGLHGAEFTIGPDYLEVGSFIGLAAVTRSALRIADCRPHEHGMTRIMLNRLGVDWRVDGNDIVVPDDQQLAVIDDQGHAVPKIDDAPWPGFPADLISIATVIATQARGAILIHEKLFESRLFFVDRLINMGARIILCDPHRAVVIGPSPLYGQALISPDIRAGMALLIAALCAEGESVIDNVHQIDRGYEHIEERLVALGADVRRS